jgi:hypothetical protein
MTTTDEKTTSCRQCRFWDEIRQDRGNCRRYAPRATPEAVATSQHTGELESAAVFPITFGDDWCGEYQGDKS